MLYAILAYHVETEVMSWTPEEDAAVMTDLHEVHDRLNQRRKRSGRRRGWARRSGPAPCAARAPDMVHRRPVCRDQGAVAGLLRRRLRQRRSGRRGRPRPAPRQSQRGLRDPPDPALSAGCPLPGDGGGGQRSGRLSRLVKPFWRTRNCCSNPCSSRTIRRAGADGRRHRIRTAGSNLVAADEAAAIAEGLEPGKHILRPCRARDGDSRTRTPAAAHAGAGSARRPSSTPSSAPSTSILSSVTLSLVAK